MSAGLEPGRAPREKPTWSGAKAMWVVVGVLFAAVLIMHAASGEDACQKAQDAKVHADDPNFTDRDAAVLEFATQQNQCERGK